jgi:hypothetical protein
MRSKLCVTAVALAAFAVGCSDSTAPNDVTADDLVGSWRATAATFTPDGGTPVNLLAGGLDITLGMRATGSYLLLFVGGERVGVLPTSEVGNYSVGLGVLTLTALRLSGQPDEIPGQRTFDIVSLVGNTLTLSDPDAVKEDDEGGDVTGTLRLVLGPATFGIFGSLSPGCCGPPTELPGPAPGAVVCA